MKKKTRNITVNNEKYAYWYSLTEEGTLIFVSPAGDKTIRACFRFENDPNRLRMSSPWFWRMSGIKAKKNQQEVEIDILMPKFIAQLIQVSIEEYPNLFQERNRKSDINNAYSLFAKLGYEEIEPIWKAALW